MSQSETIGAAAVLVGAGDVVVEERARPVPGPGQVLVEVASVGVCGSDVHYFTEGRIGDYVVDAPLVLGHETSGRIVEVGSGVDPARVGERVALEPGLPCRQCPACRSGHYNLCSFVRFFATPPIDGTFQRWVVHEALFSHPIPDGMSDDAGALLEPLSVGVWANWKGRVRVGERVLVTGAGPIGLLAAAVAAAAGAVEVVVSDPVAARRVVAAGYGATATVDPADGLAEGGFDVLLECSGAAPAVDAGIRAVRPSGRAVLVGMASEPRSVLPTQVIQNREIELTGTFRYAGTYPTAIALVEAGRVDLDGLVTGHYGLGDVVAALTAARRDPATIKPMVVPGL